MTFSIFDRRLAKLERKYHPATMAAEEILIYSGPNAAKGMQATDGKQTWLATEGETLKAFRSRISEASRGVRWLTFFGLPDKAEGIKYD